MSDPGRAYLYNSSSKQQASNPQNKHRRSSTPASSRRLTPKGFAWTRQRQLELCYSHIQARRLWERSKSCAVRWDLAVGNLEDARVAFDVIARAVEDAVYLDEEAYKQVQPTMQFTVRLQAQQHRITELEQQLDEANERLLVVEHACQESQKQASALQEELDSNAEVFKMHYGELLAKEDELSKLRVVVQALSGR
ncbi:hypothetical protein WJX73_010919 [Symbiochloris irregularis]|uniref:Uncharacterized protein n=1 Tax=Symbiochloris irregularis TaxID=706552 RepID=A0AAW1PFQ4_9CHLO